MYGAVELLEATADEAPDADDRPTDAAGDTDPTDPGVVPWTPHATAVSVASAATKGAQDLAVRRDKASEASVRGVRMLVKSVTD